MKYIWKLLQGPGFQAWFDLTDAAEFYSIAALTIDKTGGTKVTFTLAPTAASLSIPREILKGIVDNNDPERRLITEAEAWAQGASQVAALREAVSQYGNLALATTGSWFFGAQPFAGGAVRGNVVLDFSAALKDPVLSIGVRIEAVASVNAEIAAGPLAFQADWTIAVEGRVNAGAVAFDLDLQLPLPWLRLPPVDFSALTFSNPITITLGAVKAKLPPWLADLAGDFQVTTKPVQPMSISLVNGFLTLNQQFDSIVLERTGPPAQPILTAENVTLLLNVPDAGGTPRTKLTYANLSLAPILIPDGTAKNILGLPVSVSWSGMEVRLSVSASHSINCTVDIREIALAPSNNQSSALSFQLSDLVFIDGKYSTGPNITLTNITGPPLTINVTPFKDLLANAGTTLCEIAVSAGAGAANAARKLGAFFSGLFRGFSTPSVGPVNMAWPAIGSWLEGLLEDASIQLIVDVQARILQRIVISGKEDRVAGGSTQSTAVLTSSLGFTIEAGMPADARLALTVETAGPARGDWNLFAVRPTSVASGTAWLVLKLSSDLWLKRTSAGGNDVTELAQDSDDIEARPTDPALSITWTYDQAPALALLGVQNGKCRFLQTLPASSGGGGDLLSLNAGQVRITSAGGIYKLAPVDLSGKWDIFFDETRVLPFLRKKDTNGTGLSQRLKLKLGKHSIYHGRQVALPVELKLWLVNSDPLADPDLKATAKATLDLDTWRFGFEGNKIDFYYAPAPSDPAPKIFGLELKVDCEKDAPLFSLDLSGEPKLALVPPASLQLIYSGLAKSKDDGLLTFKVSNFAMSRSGISLDASATNDKPIKLAGVESYFHFKHADLRVRDSRIEGFSLEGTGSLPPKLVGDARVNASLQFATVGNELKLVKAHAVLDKKGDPIDCPSLRFRFTITQLGFEFAEENGVNHFYFLLSGSAEFRPCGDECSGGLLQYLKNAKIELNQCPLTSDASVLKKHIRFTLPTPRLEPINLFNLFRFEIRSIGFEPSFPSFDGEPAIKIGGQIKFAEIGDVIEPDIEFHALYFGPPKSGDTMPRIRCEGLRLGLKIDSKIRVRGSLVAVDGDLATLNDPPLQAYPADFSAKGFLGDGELELEGLPPIAASFGYLEISEPGGQKYLAWFVYLQMGHLSYEIPAPIPLFIREVGFGFGYRFTLVGIKAAENAANPQALITAMDDISRRQGDLARYSAWAPDIGGDAKFTLALRAMIAMSTASAPNTNEWNPEAEKELVNPFLLDVVAALRSDFTFMMSVRLWLAVNYNDFLEGGDEVRQHPLVTGYLYLDGAHNMFLARLVSQPDAFIGNHPIIPDLVKDALRSVRFSATLLMRPGLLHFELGWPDQLRWEAQFGPLHVKCVGGCVFRIEGTQLMEGMNFGASGQLALSARAGGDSFGASISAVADVAFVTRMIGVVDAARLSGSMFYGLIAIDIGIEFQVEAWLSWKVFGHRISISIGFSFGLQISVALELVLTGDPDIAGRARAYVGIRAFGRTLGLQVHLAVNEGKVEAARARVARYLDIGLAGPSQLTDPFASGGTMQNRMLTDKNAPLLASTALANGSAKVANASKFVAWTLKLSRLPQGYTPPASVTPAKLVLVVLIPDENGFYRPPLPRGPAPAYDYRVTGLPKNTQLFDATSRQWIPAPQNSSALIQTRFDASVADGVSLSQYFRQTFREDPANSGTWIEALPRGIGHDPVVLDALNDDQRGRQLREAHQAIDPSNGLVTDENAVCHDARDFLLAKFLEDMKQFAERPDTPATNTLHALDMGLTFVVAESDLADITNMEVEVYQQTGLRTVALHNDPATAWFGNRNPLLADVEIDNKDDRIEFAWDLRWSSPIAQNEPEPEEFLWAYEVRRRIESPTVDVSERVWQIKPCDTLGKNQDGVWTRFRTARQLVDDFSEASLPESLRNELKKREKTHELSYVITPICQAGTPGEPAYFHVTRSATELLPAATTVEMAWSFNAIADLKEVAVTATWDPCAFLPTLPRSRKQGQLLNEDEWVACRTRFAPSSAGKLGSRLIFRPEELAIGGEYGRSPSLQRRDVLGAATNEFFPTDWYIEFSFNAQDNQEQLKNAASLPSTNSGDQAEKVSQSITLNAETQLSQIGITGTIKLGELLKENRGQRSWRIFLQLFSNDGAAPLVEVSQNILPIPSGNSSTASTEPPKHFTVSQAFEWPFTFETKAFAAPQIRVGPVTKREPTGSFFSAENPGTIGLAANLRMDADRGVAYELAWPLRENAEDPPVAAFQLEELQLDEIPPRLIDGKNQIRPECDERVRPIDEVTVIAPELDALLPNNNRDPMQWDAIYPSESRAANPDAGQPIGPGGIERSSSQASGEIPFLLFPDNMVNEDQSVSLDAGPFLLLPTVPDSLLDQIEHAFHKPGGDPALPDSLKFEIRSKDKPPPNPLPKPALLMTNAVLGLSFVLDPSGALVLRPIIDTPNLHSRALLRSVLSHLWCDPSAAKTSSPQLIVTAHSSLGEAVELAPVPLNKQGRIHPMLQWLGTAWTTPHRADNDQTRKLWWRIEYQSANETKPEAVQTMTDPSSPNPADDGLPNSITSWIAATGSGTDPYGWLALRALGLSTTIRIYDRSRDGYLNGEEIAQELRQFLRQLAPPAPPAPSILPPELPLPSDPHWAWNILRGFLFVDLLLKPARLFTCGRFELTRPESRTLNLANDGLAMLQLSLRPRIYKRPNDSITQPDLHKESAHNDYVNIYNTVQRLNWTAIPPEKIKGDESLPSNLHAHVRRFVDFGRRLENPPQLDKPREIEFALAAPRNRNPSIVAPDASGILRYNWVTKDRWGQQRAYRFRPIGRYQQILAQPKVAVATVTSGWAAIQVPRTEPVTAPAALDSRMLSVTSPAPKSSVVPVWQIVIARHSEQTLAESNKILQSRVQFKGMLRSLLRSPADANWLSAVQQWLDKGVVPSPISIVMPELDAEFLARDNLFDRAWSIDVGPDSPKPWEGITSELWKGADVVRLPALPYCYRHDLTLAARSGLRVSQPNFVTMPREEIVRAEIDPLTIVTNLTGSWKIQWSPRRYDDFLAEKTREAWESNAAPANEIPLRSLPDPDVSYQIEMVVENGQQGALKETLIEPVASIVRSPTPTPTSLFAVVPLSRRWNISTLVVESWLLNPKAANPPLSLTITPSPDGRLDVQPTFRLRYLRGTSPKA